MNDVQQRALEAMNAQNSATPSTEPTPPAPEVAPVHAEIKQDNPANVRETRVTEATRIPMSVPEQKLQVPDIPGYHLHWFVGANITRALRAGYEYVDDTEVTIRNFGLADDLAQSGSTDLGSRISIAAGRGMEDMGQAGRLYLMKLRQEWWDQDQAKLEERNDKVAKSLRGGRVPGDRADADIEAHRTTPEWAPQRNSKANNLFVKKHRR